MNAPDVAIVGGGVVGLAVAWRLAMQGASVTVVDGGHAGQATRAAAGMLAPLAETSVPSPLLPLALDSLRRFPDFVAALQGETSQDIALCGPGLLRVALTDEEAEALCRAFSWQKQMGLPLHWLSGDATRTLEGSLSPSIRAAVLSPLEKHVPPRLLHNALHAACRQGRVRLLPGADVTGFVTNGEQVTAVNTTHGSLPCGQMVIAGGAWSAGIAAFLRLRVLLRPIRGQAVALRPQGAFLRHTVYSSRGYLVPRADGQVIVGATEEDAGFDARPTAAGVASLLQTAARLVPTLSNAAWNGVNVGLRPVSADGLPLLGRVPGWDNAFVAAGHGRNGILLAPLTADLMADCLLRGAPPPPVTDPSRFGRSDAP